MQSYDLALQNFSVAEHLLQLYQLFNGLKSHEASGKLKLALCESLGMEPGSACHHANNENMFCCIKATMQVPSCLMVDEGLCFLLRQSITVSCAALESFFWDVLRENALTVIRAKERKADKSLQDITLTLDDYLSIENYKDADLRLREIILKNFERGTLYDISKIDKIAGILFVNNLWNDAAKRIGVDPGALKKNLSDLITRRNHIAHRADRPKEDTPRDEIDTHGLRKISFAWANSHVSTAKSFVAASAELFETAIKQLEQIVEHKKEQELARKTMAPN